MLTEAQRLDRINYLGGSDIATIMGVNPYKNIIQLYLEKIGYNQSEDISHKPAVKAGNYLEPALRQWFSDETGLTVLEERDTIYHSEYPWMAANIDGRIEGKNEILEIKTSRSDKGWGDSGTDEIPDYYLTQVAHYCIVTGSERCHIAVLINASDFRIYRYERNEKLESAIIEAEKRFWLEHVKKEIPPEPITGEQVMTLHGVITGSEPKISDSNIDLMITNFIYHKIRRDYHTKLAEELKDKICSYMDESDLLLDQWGNKLATWKSRKGSALFDRKRFKQDYPDLEKQYTIEGEPTRVFSVVDKDK